jgi:predicted permease
MLAVATRWQPALTGAGESEQLNGDRVSAGYFRVLGVAPAVGRDFISDDETIGPAQYVIVSDALARRRFGGAEAVVNQTVMLDDWPHTVVGVMPAGFENVLAPSAEVWSTLQYRRQAPFDSGEWGHHLRMIGRLGAGVAVPEAQREVDTIAGNPTEEFPRPPSASLERSLDLESLQGTVTAAARPALLAIASAVLLLLILACANVTNLLLARSIDRRSELAVRAALGAGQPRLVRQLLTESLMLSFVGGVVGLAVAIAGVRVIVALAPAGLPRLSAVGLDLKAFLFAFAVTSLVGLAVGIVPALRGARTDLRLDLHSGLRTTRGTQHVMRRGLVVVEVALALVLLSGAGLLLRSVERLFSTSPGFDASNLLTMQVVATNYSSRSEAETLQFFQSAVDAVRGVPGVIDAAFSTQLPLSGDYDAHGVRFESDLDADPNAMGGVLRYVVTPDWFRTMGIPLREGRLLGAEDRPGAPEAVVLSESYARRLFGSVSPIGERLRIGPENFAPDRPWDVVVGVVGDVKQGSLGLAQEEAFYVALGQWIWVDMVQSLVVRTEGDPAAFVPAIREAVWSVDRTPPLARISTMEDLVAASEAQRRFVLVVLAIFAAAALVLAGLGLYGVIAGSVAERTREIGVRSALGAAPRVILSLVLREGMTLAGFGAIVGLVGALAATRGLESLLYGVTPLDFATYFGVIVLLAGVCALASFVPAWRAAKVDPTAALRSD